MSRSGKIKARAPRLVERYRFHLAGQRLSKRFSSIVRDLEDTLAEMSRASEPNEMTVKAWFRRLRGIHGELTGALNDADAMDMPQLASHERGEPLGHFLLQGDPISGAPLAEGHIDGAWIQAFFAQTAEVQHKLARLLRKNQAALVRHHEALGERP